MAEQIVPGPQALAGAPRASEVTERPASNGQVVVPIGTTWRPPLSNREMADYLAGLKIAVALGLRERPVVVALRATGAR